ncbi:DUF2273 domain-containing protein [Paenibacillus sp. sptzw28]|nr:DUF2273 domain-containing protein [Paenibacillus sp. sptzw28]
MKSLDLLMPYRSRVIGIVIGTIISILFLTLGAGPTFLIVLLMLSGFLVGKWIDRGIKLKTLLNFLFLKK